MIMTLLKREGMRPLVPGYAEAYAAEHARLESIPRKPLDPSVTTEQFQAALKTLGIDNAAQLAETLGKSPRTGTEVWNHPQSAYTRTHAEAIAKVAYRERDRCNTAILEAAAVYGEEERNAARRQLCLVEGAFVTLGILDPVPMAIENAEADVRFIVEAMGRLSDEDRRALARMTKGLLLQSGNSEDARLAGTWKDNSIRGTSLAEIIGGEGHQRAYDGMFNDMDGYMESVVAVLDEYAGVNADRL